MSSDLNRKLHPKSTGEKLAKHLWQHGLIADPVDDDYEISDDCWRRLLAAIRKFYPEDTE